MSAHHSHLVERLWGGPEEWQRVASRYDKLAANFLSDAPIAATLTFLVQLSPEPSAG